ncbi:HD domain-containing protein [Pontibacillus yanchengensis]|uniref:HD domain-containing protein n=2 Tax=Pontibacillus yanchengensis TaxID=462910 RepID=A0ACC7VAC8_9BACI|nr:HD domain-containing protein [Pontibacillus yanchengensis]MYL32816.1 HD domain-containing protein [Pontibacillus yanchengensis]MYL51728.1 HD domain-containing protein [Pontibacillus yanchengensis]
MNQEEIRSCTKQYVASIFQEEPTGHDFEHMKRVANMAAYIADEEGADPFICEMAGWLHDVTDGKLTDNENQAKENLHTFLHKLPLETEDKNAILAAMKDVSFRGKHIIPYTYEGKIVQDADRLDAIGAIGIARTFAFGGNKEQLLYTEDEQERSQPGTSIQHFYDKLLHLKGYMNTPTAISLAEERHAILEKFLNDFHEEWKKFS